MFKHCVAWLASCILCIAVEAISPAELVKRMGVGYNLGATLSAPHEGDWFPPAEEWIFDEIKAKGFKNVRIPVTWDAHADADGNVNPSWLARVEEVASWAVKRGMIALVDACHEYWIDDPSAFESKLSRFNNIWSQASIQFANYSNSEVVFEVLNEPRQMSVTQLNSMHQTILQTVRKSHSTRIVQFMGLNSGNPNWFYEGAGGSSGKDMWWPQNDSHVMLQFHSYDPFEYAGMGTCSWEGCPPGNPPLPVITQWGSSKDKSKVTEWMDKLKQYADARGLAVHYGELGVTHSITAAGGRYEWYKYHHEEASRRGFSHSPWDGGSYELLYRTNRSWDEGVLQALGLNGVEGVIV